MTPGGFIQSIFQWITLVVIFVILEVGCVAQQADVARIQKDLEQQISQLKSEKVALGEEVLEARSAIAESKKLIDAQKADMSKMRSDLAPLNQQIKLLREQDLTSLYGQFELTEKKLSDLRHDFDNQTEKLANDIQTLQANDQTHAEQQQLTQTQAEALTQQVDEKNQVLTDKMTEFQTAFGQFKNALADMGTELQDESQRASSAEAQLGTEISNFKQEVSTDLTTHQQTLQSRSDELWQAMDQLQETVTQSGVLLGSQLDEHATQQTELSQKITLLQDKLDTDTQALRTFLEQDVKTSMDQLVKDMDAKQRPLSDRLDALQSDMETLGTHVQADAAQVQELTQSMVKLREAQEVMGSLLGKRGDEIIQQAGRISERLNAVEAHQSTLGEQLQSNTTKTSTHLTEVNASLTSLSENLDRTTQSLSSRLAQQEQTLATMKDAIQEFQQLKGETQGQIQQMQIATQVSDELRQNVEHVTKRMQDLEIHQSELVGKLDSDAQTTTTHLQEVNNGINSVAQALENVSEKLNARISTQGQQLNRAITKFQNAQNTTEVSQANVKHLNDLTGSMNQLQEVITTIGTKLGERVDEHEDRLSQLAQRVNRLQGTKTKK